MQVQVEAERYARDCVRLAQGAGDSAMRETLLQMAREWMAVVMAEPKLPEPKLPPEE
jgi:hypothetical protein